MKSLLQICMSVLIYSLFIIQATAVERVYVPEEHFLFLNCRRGSDVEWTHGVTRISATKQRSLPHHLEQARHQLLSNGTLFIRDLEETDSGLYYCNGQLVANVSVLTGHNLVVSEWGTLYLPCSPSIKPKQRWAYKHKGDWKREFISTRYKNGTVVQERADPDSRFIHTYNHLQIVKLQLPDTGSYLCNGKDIATVTVTRTESVEHLTATTESTETQNPTLQVSDKVMIAVLVLSVLVAFVVTLLSVTVCLKFRQGRQAPQQEETELQTPKISNQDLERSLTDKEHSVSQGGHGELQYASLGRQIWRPRHWSRESRQQVIYSTLLLSPASSLPSTPLTERL